MSWMILSRSAAMAAAIRPKLTYPMSVIRCSGPRAIDENIKIPQVRCRELTRIFLMQADRESNNHVYTSGFLDNIETLP